MKIHYRNLHGKTNLPWQDAFSRLGELSLGGISSGGFPNEIDHLHLGGSCKGPASIKRDPITVSEVKKVQKETGCAVSVLFGEPVALSFKFHHDLLDAGIPRLKVYSTAMYGTPMWRSGITWIAQPTDENIFQLVEHKKNERILFVGRLSPYRQGVVAALSKAGIEVDVVGDKYGKDLVEFSKNYSISIGMVYDEVRPKIRYSSARLPDALAMGLVYIEADFDLKGVYTSNELIQWVGIDDLIDKIRYYQGHLAEGRAIMMRGRKKVLKNWTCDKLAKRFIREGQLLKKGKP